MSQILKSNIEIILNFYKKVQTNVKNDKCLHKSYFLHIWNNSSHRNSNSAFNNLGMCFLTSLYNTVMQGTLHMNI
jgi:hypothetical protein